MAWRLRPALGLLPLLISCGPSGSPDRDGGESGTSTTTTSATAPPSQCESDEFGLIDFCFRTPSEDEECSCTGDCLDEALLATTREYGGNCDYRLAEVTCAGVGDDGTCCYTVVVDVNCGTG